MRRATRIGMPVLLGVLLAVSTSGGESTQTPTAESVTSRLTGGGQEALRWWVKSRVVMVLSGRSPQCESGEIWLFSQDGNGIKKICENGVMREQKFTWAWVGTQSAAPILKVDEKQYVIEFRQLDAKVEGDPPILVTILRVQRASQGEPVEEIRLEFKSL